MGALRVAIQLVNGEMNPFRAILTTRMQTFIVHLFATLTDADRVILRPANAALRAAVRARDGPGAT